MEKRVGNRSSSVTGTSKDTYVQKAGGKVKIQTAGGAHSGGYFGQKG